MRIDWLTGYGLSNLEALLTLVAMIVLLVGVWWWIRHRWCNATRRMESAIAEVQQRAISFRVSWAKQSARVANSRVNSRLPSNRVNNLEASWPSRSASAINYRTN